MKFLQFLKVLAIFCWLVAIVFLALKIHYESQSRKLNAMYEVFEPQAGAVKEQYDFSAESFRYFAPKNKFHVGDSLKLDFGIWLLPFGKLRTYVLIPPAPFDTIFYRPGDRFYKKKIIAKEPGMHKVQWFLQTELKDTVVRIPVDFEYEVLSERSEL